MRTNLRHVVHAFYFLERGLLIAVMMAMVLCSVLGIVVREIVPTFASTVAWTDEAARLFMVWTVFLGLGLALGKKRHIAVTMILERLSVVWRQIIRTMIDMIGFIFCLYLVWLGIELASFVRNTGQVSPTLNLPMYWIYVAPTVGFFLTALRYGLSIIVPERDRLVTSQVATITKVRS